MSHSYTKRQISEMNCNSLWNGHIINAEPLYSPNNDNADTKYKLYSTGYADMGGRKYVALPENLIITEQVKRRYNLWP